MAFRVSNNILNHGFIPCAYYFLRLYVSLLRVRVIGEEAALDHLAKGGRIIAALWHQRFLGAVAYVTKFRRLNPCVMISQSRDGDLIAPIALRLGLEPVRGSGSKDGKKALSAIVEALKEKPAAVHVVDGPRGPKGEVKPGLIRMAQISGATIFPIFISAEKAWLARSWDRFLVPKPFSRVTIRWGQPFLVPKEKSMKSFENLRKFTLN